MSEESNSIKHATFNPKKNKDQRRKRHPLQSIGNNMRQTIVKNPKSKKSFIVTSSTLEKSAPCKDCTLRSRMPGSSRCQECSKK